jgi:N-acetylneuraminic acid mutarotase
VSTSTAAPKVVVRRLAWRLPQPVARQAVADLSGTQAVLAGGLLAGDTSTASAYRLDLITGRTHALPSLPVPVHDSAGGAYDGGPAVYGGGNATEQATVQRLGAHGWTVAATLPTTRSDLSVVVGGGSTYVLGGYDGAGTPTAVLRATGSRIATVGHLRVGVRYAASAVVGNEAYLFGGEVNDRELSVVQRVDLATGRTTQVATLPHALGHAMAVTIGGRILLAGGTTAYQVRTRQLWWFDPTNGQFTRAGKLPVEVSDASLVAVPSGALLMGGQHGIGSGGESDAVYSLSLQ